MKPIRTILSGVLIFLIASCGHFYQRSYVQSPESLQSIASIAVAPFENLTQFAEAGKLLSDLFSSELTKLKKYNIVDRSMVERRLKEKNYKLGKSIDRSTAKDIGGFLGVDAVLIGSATEYSYQSQPGIRQTEPAIGFSVRLVDVKTGMIIWAASVSRSSYDVFTFERDPVNAVAQAAVEAVVGSNF